MRRWPPRVPRSAAADASVGVFAEEFPVTVRSGAVTLPEQPAQIVAVAESAGHGDLLDGTVGLFEHNFPTTKHYLILWKNENLVLLKYIADRCILN